MAKRKPGRPPLDEPRDKRIYVAATEAEVAEIDRQSQAAGLTRHAYCRQQLFGCAK